MTDLSSIRPEVVLDAPLRLGESAIWHADERRLYFADIEGKTLRSYDPVSDAHEIVLSGETVADVTIQANGSLLLFQAAGRISRLVDGRTVPVRPDIAEDHATRFNDVFADPEGRVYCGTMPSDERSGRLYRLDPDGTLTVVIEDAGVSNGMGITTDLRHFYHTNTTRRTITRYPYVRATGDLGLGEIVVQIAADSEDHPDGMTLDADDRIWSASYGGGRITHYEADGTLIGTVDFPARKMTSIAFAGDDLTTAYATSAEGPGRPATGPLAGSLFRFTPGVVGKAPFRSRILLDEWR